MKDTDMAKPKINPGTKITSTSDFTIGDIIDAVAANLDTGEAEKSIAKVVKSVVRPCAIGGVPTVMAGHAANDGSVAGDGNTKRFRNGRRVNGGCDGLSPDYDADAGIEITGRMATDEDRISRRTCAGVRDGGDPKIAVTSKWYNAVLQNGEVWTPYTSRRFLPAQYLGLMLAHDGNVDAAIARRYSLRDCFRLLDTEIEKLEFMRTHWHTAFLERSKFLTVPKICEIFTQYLEGLKDNANDRAKCTFNSRTGVYWRKIQGEGRVELWKRVHTSGSGDDGAEFERTDISPTSWLVSLNRTIAEAEKRVRRCKTYVDALDILRNSMPSVSMGTFRDQDGCTRFWLPKAWKEAFKRQGAYYTLKSLVVNCHVRYTTEGGSWRNRTQEMAGSAREGLNKLRALLDTDTPAYVIHAILKKSIEASRFDIAKFLRSLRRR